MSFDIISLKGLILCLGFLLSGIVDAVCGGGGLITLPLFMATGFPPHFITGTNQSSIVAGGTASLFRFAKSGHIHWRSALMTVPFAIIGAVIGALTAITLGSVQWYPLPAIWGWPLVQNLPAYLSGMAAGITFIALTNVVVRYALIRAGKMHIE